MACPTRLGCGHRIWGHDGLRNPNTLIWDGPWEHVHLAILEGASKIKQFQNDGTCNEMKVRGRGISILNVNPTSLSSCHNVVELIYCRGDRVGATCRHSLQESDMTRAGLRHYIATCAHTEDKIAPKKIYLPKLRYQKRTDVGLGPLSTLAFRRCTGSIFSSLGPSKTCESGFIAKKQQATTYMKDFCIAYHIQ